MIAFEQLTRGQRNAYDRSLYQIKNKKKHILINGPAGTGKTTLTKFLIDSLVRSGESGIILAAPTHQAKKVLAKMSGMEAATIHSILKINPTTYEENTIFEQREIPDLASCRVLICDEWSMYDRKLFDILMNTIPSWCTVIALGDKAQIRPVAPGDSGPVKVSPFYTDVRFEHCYLDEVMRSNAPIIEVATEIREGGWIRENIIDGHGVHGFTGDNALRDFMMQYFDIVRKPEDMFENRMYAYTNKSVDTLNSIIRRKIYKTEEPFIVGEVLVMQEPFMHEMQFEGKKFTEIIFNNGQQIRVLNATQTSTFLKAKGVSGEYMIRYWVLEVESIDDSEEYAKAKLNVIYDKSELDKFHFFLAKVATAYKSGEVKAHWKDFWAAKRIFSKVKPLPVSTIHKSQGSSVDASFLYTPCIHMADTELALQLLYVGSTRARNDVYFV